MIFHIYSGTGFGALLTLYKVGVREGVILLFELHRVRWVFTLLVHVVSNRRYGEIYYSKILIGSLTSKVKLYINLYTDFVPSASKFRGA